MKQLFTLLFVIGIMLTAFSQATTRNFTWDGTDREYIEYVPAIYDAGSPAPVIFCLHGLGDNMSNFSGLGFHQLADQTGWIVITPQALMATVAFLGDLGTAWNSGAGAEGIPMLGNVILSDGVDDSGFLMAVLDSLENNFNIDTDSVFFMGFSMGGFMSNRIAAEHSDRVTAIASVSGTIGKFFDPLPTQNVNALHFHGDADTQVTYEDAGFDTGAGVYSVGMGAEECVEFWRNYNNTDVSPIVTYFPDTQSDGKTFERYLYLNGDNNSYNAFIKVLGGDHEWYYSPVNDIDYTTEIYKFLTNNMDFPTDISDKDQKTDISIYPNPANDALYISSANVENAVIQITDVKGREIISKRQSTNLDRIDISVLNAGVYFVKIISDEVITTEKLIVY